MARYVVLTSDMPIGGQRARVMRDGFSVIALAFPLPWLLFNRLWIEALTVFLVMICIGMLVSQVPTIGISLSANLALGVLVGLEGERWAIAKAKRRGSREIGAVSEAGNQDEAELIAFHHYGTAPTPAEPKSMTANPAAPDGAGDIMLGRA
ncbi:MAG: DUF2628 domain-containing protein [Pseudomonadota bacterium]